MTTQYRIKEVIRSTKHDQFFTEVMNDNNQWESFICRVCDDIGYFGVDVFLTYEAALKAINDTLAYRKKSIVPDIVKFHPVET